MVPLWLLALLAAVAAAIIVYSFYASARGAWARALAFIILLFALAGPLLVRETHAPLPDVVAVITDRSQSMGLGQRAAQAEQARSAIRKMLAANPGLTVREASVTTTTSGENNGTDAFTALNGVLQDVPPGRIAGAIMITDGQVHDVPRRTFHEGAAACADRRHPWRA